MSRGYGSGTFTPVAKIYAREECHALIQHQKQQVTDFKVAEDWVSSQTPPHGFVLDANGQPTPSTRLVAAVQ